MSCLRANAGPYRLDTSLHRDTDVHLYVQARSRRQDGTSVGAPTVTTLLSLFTGRRIRRDLTLTGGITSSISRRTGPPSHSHDVRPKTAEPLTIGSRKKPRVAICPIRIKNRRGAIPLAVPLKRES